MDGAPLEDAFFPSLVINLDEETHRCHLTIPWKHQACSCRTMSRCPLLLGGLPAQ